MILTRWLDKDTPLTYRDSDVPIDIPRHYIEKRFRALWVSNVVNIDMPTTEDVKAYRRRMEEIVTVCKAYHLNAIFFQVRTTNDAFYASKHNPYSRYLTGKEGVAPPFDVVAEMISMCKAAGIEFHAWMNPYRVSMAGSGGKADYLKTCDDLNYAKRHPQDVLQDAKGQCILNPAKASVKRFIIDTVVELASEYDIDGIHFDDYFYPYAGFDEADDDRADFEAREDKTLSLDAFRRANVDALMAAIGKRLKAIRASLRYGISPFGIWRTKQHDPRGANVHPDCFESYDRQYADSLKWVEEGFVDYIVPQLYWPFEHERAPFADLCRWWADVCEGRDVDLYIGHGAYRLGGEGPFENPLEIVNQVKYANARDVVKGNVFFTFKTFVDEQESREGMQALKDLLTRRKHDETSC